MSQKSRRFTKEFRAEAVRRVTEGGHSQTSVARELGISKTVLGRWKREAEGRPEQKVEIVDVPEAAPIRDPATLDMTPEEELKYLRRKVNRLEQEREFLKKATAFFARELP